MAVHEAPGSADSPVKVESRYDNFIGGEWTPPSKGDYFENITPVTGQAFTEIARSTGEDVELALDAAHGARRAWGRTTAAERANILNKIADRIEENLPALALAETWENGKPIRETMAADLPLAVDHFHYFAGAIRAQEGGISEIDADTVSIYDQFMSDAIERVKKIKQGNPLDEETMIGAQASNDQLEKILSYLDIGKQEGAKVLAGGERARLDGDNSMRIFQEEIFGPVVPVAKLSDEADALKIANDTLYGLGAGVWTRDGGRAYRAGREIQAGRVWTNCYHAYPAHAAFGGYKQFGVGRENHKMMLDRYQNTKNLLVSYSPTALGFFQTATS